MAAHGTRVFQLHYAWVVVLVTFAMMLVTASVRAAPGVLIKPLEAEFGWDRAAISLAVGIGFVVNAIGLPLGGGLLDRFGPKRVALLGISLMVLSLAPMPFITQLWHLHLLWGVVNSLGAGIAGGGIGAAVASRWFRKHRGMVIGLFGAAGSAGTLVFIPLMMSLNLSFGWRSAILLLLAIASSILVPLALLFRDRPEDVGRQAFGDDGTVSHAERANDTRRTPLRQALRTSDYWCLLGSFFICGYTSTGLIGVHLIPHTIEHGFSETTAAAAVGLMGMMNVVGTLGSGWLSDRFDNRKLLGCYYGFRALSLAALPFILQEPGLYVFAIVFGLDYVATVPATVKLTASIFGRASLGILWGWILFSHQIGSATAAYAGGLFRVALGDYHVIFLSAAVMGFVAVGLSLRVNSGGQLAPRPAPSPT
jgi:MFS family permease